MNRVPLRSIPRSCRWPTPSSNRSPAGRCSARCATRLLTIYAITRWEFATPELAARCGPDVPEKRLTLVNRRPVLLVARFDRRLRAGARERAHYLSGLTMLGLHERDYGRGSYSDLAHWLRRHGAAPRDDALELFHRNHAVIDFGEGFRLSPLFDVMPWPATGGERMQAIGVGHEGRLATIENALSDSGLFGLAGEAAKAEVRTFARVVREKWEACFRSAGAGKRELEMIARILRHQVQAVA